MIGHLGPRVSALLDDQLPAAEAERAWSHVLQCPSCHERVTYEGWVKTRLAELTQAPHGAPRELRGVLLAGAEQVPRRPEGFPASSRRRQRSVGALGGGAIGVAMVGVLVLGAAPAQKATERRVPASQVAGPSPSPAARPGTSQRDASGSRLTSVVQFVPTRSARSASPAP